MTVPPLFEIEELFADPTFSDATISPDGTRLAYLAPAHGRLNVWVRGIDQEHADAVLVTHSSTRSIGKYAWTGNPRYLVFMQDDDGNEDWHLHRVDLDNPDAEPVDLTPNEPGVRVFGFEELEPYPGKLVIPMNKRLTHIDHFLVDLETGETTVLYENPSMMGGFLLGPTGKVIFTQLAENGSNQLFDVDVETGEQRLFFETTGPEHPLGIYPCEITADGKGVLLGLYLDDDDLKLVRVDIRTGEKAVVAGRPGRSICTASAVVQGALPPTMFTRKSTGEVLAVRYVGDKPELEILDEEFARVYANLAKLSDGVLAGFSCDESETKYVVTFTHDRDPGVTYFYDHSTGESRLLFRPHPDRDPEHFAEVKGASITARDGLPLHAFLTLPVGVEAKNLPLVLHVHGGPWFHDTWGFDRETQFFANRGYAVLQVNMRGSSGYGKRHTTAAIREFAGAMHNDLVDFADWAVEQGIADPTRIGIYGGSYGGYAALVGVTFTPDYFAAAVDFCGISDLANFMATLPDFAKPSMINNWYLYVGDPDDPEQRADMLARSPITHVDKITTPLLITQGANDARVVQAEADNIVAALRSRGVPVGYLLAEDEGHGFVNVENNIKMFHLIEDHFGTYLGGRTGCSDPRSTA
jgi:dipeptidyl aminopeptidase/acylaminoacyl peptidase